MKTPGERLAEYIENEGFTKKDFCDTADLAYNNFVRVLSGKRPLGVNVLDKVKAVLTNLNVNWVLYNEGSPHVNINEVREEGEVYGKNPSLEDLVRKIVNEEVNPRFDSINKSVYLLMKRDIKEVADQAQKDKQAG